VIARGTPGFSGADLANLVNEAALLAARAGRNKVAMVDFEAAKDKIMMGSERRSMIMSDQEKQLTAYHEAGHALVGLLVPGVDPLHKVTIIPRGRALGVTMNLPERDRYSLKKSEIEARLAMMFGGRVAEDLIFGADNVTTGASNDIQQATGMARRMVTEWGMSEKLGRLRYSENEEEVFLGRSVTRTQSVSDDTALLIDIEVRRIIGRLTPPEALAGDPGYAQGSGDRARMAMTTDRTGNGATGKTVAPVFFAGIALAEPVVMGILNVTPDSFSDGGDVADPAVAIATGIAMRDAGAAILDVGGESTRPGSDPVSVEEELRRVIPVIRGLAAAGGGRFHRYAPWRRHARCHRGGRADRERRDGTHRR
jgi:hypothetical protein